MFSARKSLGLAVTETRITAVEVATAGSRRIITHTAELPFTASISLVDPAELAKALRLALRQNGFTASRCVIGLATGWIASREKVLPATDPESLRGALAIVAEREFASGMGELACDYATTPLDKGVAAMLVAASRRIVDPLAEAARLAGLTVTAITACDWVLLGAVRQPVAPAGRLMLVLQPQGAELLFQTPSGARLIRHLTARLDSPEASPNELGDELRRIVMMLPAEAAAGDLRELLIWNGSALPPSSLEALAHRASLTPKICDLPDLEISASTPLAGPRIAQAAALACCEESSIPVDFLHSRLTPPKTSLFGHKARWAGIAVAATLAAGILVLFLNCRSYENEAADLKSQLGRLENPEKQAWVLTEKASFALDWYDRRPAFLDCLKEVTQAFPDRGDIWATNMSMFIREDAQVQLHDDMPAQLKGKAITQTPVLGILNRLKVVTRAFPNRGDIWATKMPIHEDMQVQLTGKAVSQIAVQDVLDRLNDNPRLSVNHWSLSQVSGASSPAISFAMSLTPQGANPK